MHRIALILCLLAAMPASTFAGKIKKGYQALEMYNYFEAKRLFEKSLKKQPVPASYGLSIIYFRTDNPFHNIDSAYNFVVKAHSAYTQLDDKQKLQCALYGINPSSLDYHRELISGQLFRRAVETGSVAGFDAFIQKNYWSTRIDSAVFMRDSLAFDLAEKNGTSSDYAGFMENYPTSVYADQARARFDQKLYLESTASNTLISYLEFVKKYPENPYRTDAEDRIFEIYTQTGTVQSYEKFIQDSPSNHNVDIAWRKLYNAHVQSNSYSENSLVEFTNTFPEYPFMKELEHEMELANAVFYPVKAGEFWGFIDENANEVIPFIYEEAEAFKEGLALVKTNGKYGYINKAGKLLIQPIYDDALAFNEGHAVVEYRGKLGMINRNGEFIISPRYEDLGNLNNGLAYFLLDSLYGYFDSKGIQRIPPKFTEAFDYMDGKAIVSQNHYYGLIDAFGTTFIPMKYEELRKYRGDVYLALFNGHWGLITVKGDTLLPFAYDYIGETTCNRAIVEKDNQFNYITPKGALVLTTWLPVYAEYRQLAQFKNGYAKIEFEGKYNLVDTTGKKLFAQPKENLGDYSSLIAVSKAGKWGYLNAAGAQVIPYNFTLANSFNGNYAIAGSDPFYGLINKAGQYVIQPFYEELTYLNDTLLIAKSLGNFGVLNQQGDTLLNFVYLKIEPISDTVVKIEQGTAVFYYDLRHNKILRKEEN
ncbi:MAG: WG repeat-containing protein [Bacteroidetes bacterium]|nr:WG repeat-containing protein [Bacteroidota bacterium]